MTNVPNIPGLYTRYAVHVRFITALEGGIPTNPQLIKAWISARMKKAGRNLSDEDLEKMVQETLKKLPQDAAQEVTEGVVASSLLWNTFPRDAEGRPVFEARCIKAFFKEEANILKDVLAAEAKLQNRGQKKAKKDGAEGGSVYNTMYRSKVAEQLFVEGIVYPLLRDGKPLEDVDGQAEKAIHVMTAQGPRNALKRFDYINAGVELKFHVRILRDGVVTVHDLLRMLEHGQENGMGAARSQGNGRFEVMQVEELEPTIGVPLFDKFKKRGAA
jgi:hypothetical protein